MNTSRTFQISSDLFWGFSKNIDLATVTSLDEVIKIVKTDLKCFLKTRNLQALVEKVDDMKLHMHQPGYPFSQLLEQTSVNDILYLCDHCR